MLSIKSLCNQDSDADADADANWAKKEASAPAAAPVTADPAPPDEKDLASFAQRLEKKAGWSSKKTPRRRYSLRTKWDIIQAYKTGNYRQVDLAQMFHTSQENVSRWKNAYGHAKTFEEFVVLAQADQPQALYGFSENSQ